MSALRARRTTSSPERTLTGRASTGVDRLLRAHGFDVIAEPESFLVTKQDRLEPQETARAREWGIKLAGSIAPSSVAVNP